MSAIGLVQSTDRLMNQLQQNIKQAVTPVLRNPLVQGNLITGIALKTGDNTISHGLGQTLQGWIVVGQGSAASFYDKQASNPNTQKTLILNSSADVTINLYCF
jgi:hypothetical protein